MMEHKCGAQRYRDQVLHFGFAQCRPRWRTPQSMSVEYLVSTSSTRRLSDHLGSTSITTDADGNKVSEMRYTPCPTGMLREGEVRYAWITTTAPAPRAHPQIYIHPQSLYNEGITATQRNLSCAGLSPVLSSKNTDPTN
jgi:hypothetical protein